MYTNKKYSARIENAGFHIRAMHWVAAEWESYDFIRWLEEDELFEKWEEIFGFTPVPRTI